jgi:hypothetical protein
MTMECDQAIELLPWLANGTLDAGERQAVLDHLRGCAACRTALADTRAALPILDWHPSPDELIALAQAEPLSNLPSQPAPAATSAGPQADARVAGDAGGTRDAVDAGDPWLADIAAHVAGCPRCAAEMELVRASRRLAEAAPEDFERLAFLPQQAPARPAGDQPRPSAAPEAAPEIAPQPAASARRGGAAAERRAWRRQAVAAGLVGLVALTGWFESSRHARSLEERLATLDGSAPSTPAAGTASTSGTGSAQARLDALTAQNGRLWHKLAELSASAAELQRRTASLAAVAASGAGGANPAIESNVWVDELAPTTPAGPTTPATRGGSTAVPSAPGSPTDLAPPPIPLTRGAATLLLRTRQRHRYATYEIEVRDGQGRPVGSPAAVAPLPDRQNAFDEFDVTLRRGALAPGTYSLHLFGRAAPAGAGTGTAAGTGAGAAAGSAPREEVASYSVRVS